MSFGFGFALPAIRTSAGGNNPFNQLGPTLDLTFAGVPTDPLGVASLTDYTLNTDFVVPQYQIAAQYAIWENDVGLVSKTFSQIITFTRASTATYFDATGTLQSAAIDAPRFDYNPATLAARGFLIEEARTNSIRNNTMQGAVAGTPGTAPTNWIASTSASGVTREIVGTGTEDGITYIDIRYSGTPSAGNTVTVTFELNNQIAATAGQTWTESVFLKLQAGSFTGLSATVSLLATDGTIGTEQFNSSTITSTPANLRDCRLSISGTLATGIGTTHVQPRVRIGYTVGVAFDITLRIGLPQLELGAFATSVIPTTTTALTRSADVASVNTLSPWFNATEGSMYFEASAITVNSYPFSLFGSSTFNRIFANYSNLDRMQAGTRESGNFSSATTASGTAPLNTVGKGALSYKVNDGAFSWNGAAAIALSPLPTVLPTILRLDIGNNGSQAGNWLNGHLRRITYYPRKLSSAELQAITA